MHQNSNGHGISDRTTAGLIGGGGRWFLALRSNGRNDLWQAAWEVGNREAADHRIWRVRYGLVAENVKVQVSPPKPIDTLRGEIEGVLKDILAFADLHEIEGFAGCFRSAIKCLSAIDPFTEVYHKDLAPAGVLDLPAQQLLAACSLAWVFGGMGSWNDMSFVGAEQSHYESLSDELFALLNEGICVATNSGGLYDR